MAGCGLGQEAALQVNRGGQAVRHSAEHGDDGVVPDGRALRIGLQAAVRGDDRVHVGA